MRQDLWRVAYKTNNPPFRIIAQIRREAIHIKVDVRDDKSLRDLLKQRSSTLDDFRYERGSYRETAVSEPKSTLIPQQRARRLSHSAMKSLTTPTASP